MTETTHAAQRQTSVPMVAGINVVVSSVNYTTNTDYWVERIDETCVFFPNHSVVRGSYADHDAIVADLRHLFQSDYHQQKAQTS